MASSLKEKIFPLRTFKFFSPFVLVLWAFITLFPVSLFGQASVNVNTLDPVYRDIDKLVGHGLVKKIIMGQRPFSRREIARITGEAIQNLKKLEDRLEDPELSDKKKEKIRKRIQYINIILDRLKRNYREELIQLGILKGETKWYSVHLLEKAELSAIVTNSQPRPIPDNGLGLIDAQINPLVQYRQGRHILDGATLSLETNHWLRASNHFAFLVQPRFQLGIGRGDTPDDNKIFINNLYSKIFIKNFEIEIGRDNLFWGQGLNSGLMLSNNPRGLDMIKISNDVPFFFPWVFKYMGANKISFFYSDLGPEQNFPHAYLVGWKWSLQPLSFFEIGGSFLVHSGGEGSPSASFGRRVAEVFTLNPEDEGQQISNKLGGLDLRFRVPTLRGMELYLELIFDDRHTFEDLGGQFANDTGYVGGIYFPRLVDSGEADLRIEYHKTGKRFYEHTPFTSGMTLNKFILGDNLGPNGWGVYLVSNWDIDEKNLLTFDGAFERRSADVYTTGEKFRFIKLVDKPEESRLRAQVGWQHRVKEAPVIVRTLLGYEHVINFNFVEDNARNNVLGVISVEVDWDKWTRFPK